MRDGYRQGRRFRQTRFIHWLILALATFFPVDESETNTLKYKIVLRNLDTIQAGELTITDDYLSVSADRRFFWKDVLSASGLSENEQQQFDEAIRRQGLPLYRLEHRLTIGDDQSLTAIAEPLFEKYHTRAANENNARIHFIVYLAAFRSRLVQGHRVSALLAFSKLNELYSRFSDHITGPLLSPPLKEDLASGFSKRLIPIWFDVAAAERALPALASAVPRIDSMNDGQLVYLASLNLAVSQITQAKRYCDELEKRERPIKKTWLPLLAAQLEQQNGIDEKDKIDSQWRQLRRAYQTTNGPPRAMANYLIATSAIAHPDDRDQAVLDLLYIRANFGTRFPSLAAAALAKAADISEQAGHAIEAEIIRNELFANYKNTYHGRRKSPQDANSKRSIR